MKLLVMICLSAVICISTLNCSGDKPSTNDQPTAGQVIQMPPAEQETESATQDAAALLDTNEPKADANEPTTISDPMSRSESVTTTPPYGTTTRRTSTERYVCAECGRKTNNPPDAAGESLCTSCNRYYMEKNRKFQRQMDEGTAHECVFCGGYAAAGEGMCSSCIEKAARALGEDW